MQVNVTGKGLLCVAIFIVVAVLAAVLLSGCSYPKFEEMGGEPTEQGTKTLVLPDGRGCTGKLRYTGGGYASIHYNFNCDDGRVFIHLENAEVK